MNGLAAVAGILLVLSFWYSQRNQTAPKGATADQIRHFTSEEIVLTKRLIELQEDTRKEIERINQDGGLRDSASVNEPTADDLVFGAFPPVVAAAAKYEANVAQEHPARILLPQNLYDRR